MIITIDGYAGSGKTTAADQLAQALGFELLHTGYMYRAVGLALTEAGIDLDSYPACTERVRELVHDMHFDMPPGKVILNGKDRTADIGIEGVGELASKVGTYREVRDRLKSEQRRIADGRDMICEGRDQGTAVFPDAPIKFFFSAAATVRARRRAEQLWDKGLQADEATILEQIRERDRRDETRAIDPLKSPTGAILIDTSAMAVDAVLQRMLEVVNRCRSQA